MTNYKIFANGEISIDNKFLPVRVKTTGNNRTLYIPNDKTRGLDFKELSADVKDEWNASHLKVAQIARQAAIDEGFEIAEIVE